MQGVTSIIIIEFENVATYNYFVNNVPKTKHYNMNKQSYITVSSHIKPLIHADMNHLNERFGDYTNINRDDGSINDNNSDNPLSSPSLFLVP